MEIIDREYLERPYYGKRRMQIEVNKALMPEEIQVNLKRISRLMKVMCIEALYPKKKLSNPGLDADTHPYLLKGLNIERPNQVWATDITYIKMPRGFLYMVAVIDWYSRMILSWDLSNTMDTLFCINTLQLALDRYDKAEIFNTDQGSQFTSHEFTGLLKSNGIRVSHDGPGRALDNVIIERFWRTLKYENIYLHSYDTVEETIDGISEYMRFFNTERPHQSHKYNTPHKVYHGPNKVDQTKAF
jgi:putative transposase